MRIILIWLLSTSLAVAGIPYDAAKYKRMLIKESQLVFGLDAPVARLAGQIHQESAWNPTAQSPYADGLTQFTPSTAKWIAQIYPELGDPAPFSPRWAIRAMVRYDKRLLGQVDADTKCDAWAMALSAYNGGLGWVKRDAKLAAANDYCPYLWWDNVELFSNRAKWAFKENRGYPRNILKRWEPMYSAAGWQGGQVCGN